MSANCFFTNHIIGVVMANNFKKKQKEERKKFRSWECGLCQNFVYVYERLGVWLQRFY